MFSSRGTLKCEFIKMLLKSAFLTELELNKTCRAYRGWKKSSSRHLFKLAMMIFFVYLHLMLASIFNVALAHKLIRQ